MNSNHAAPSGMRVLRGRARLCLFVVGALGLGLVPIAEAGTSTGSQRPDSAAVPAVRSAQVGTVARLSKTAHPTRSARAAVRVVRPQAVEAAPATTLPSALDLLRGRAFGSSSYTPLADISCVAPGGNWSSPATWSGGVPTAADSVSIGNGCTVTIDTAATALSLIVFNGGVLQYEETTARTLAIGDYVTVGVGGIFRSAATGTQTGHVLSVSGGLTNGGTIDFSTNTDTAGAGIVFTGAANTSMVNSGSLDLRQANGINLNKGTSAASTLDFFPGGTITVQGANTAGFLTIANGTFRIVSSDTFTNPVFASATYTIPLTGAFWLNAPNVTVVGQAGSPTNNGLLRVTAGVLNVGTLGTHVMGAGVGAAFVVEGGTLGLAGRLNSANAFVTYTQSGGAVNVCTAGGCTTTPSFGFTGASVLMKMSGGSINLVNSQDMTISRLQHGRHDGLQRRHA